MQLTNIEELKDKLADELYKMELAELYVPSMDQLEEYYQWMQEQHVKIMTLSNQIEHYEKLSSTVDSAVHS